MIVFAFFLLFGAHKSNKYIIIHNMCFHKHLVSNFNFNHPFWASLDII